MIDAYLVLGFWLFVVILHELGHLAVFRYYGFEPDIKLKWWGVQVGENIKSWQITRGQYSAVAIAGVWLGYLPFYFLLSSNMFTDIVKLFWLFLYIFMCTIDLYGIMIHYPRKREDFHKTLYTQFTENYEKVTQEFNAYLVGGK